MKRRQFMTLFGASSLGLLLPGLARGATLISKVPSDTGTVGSIVVVGGGMAGATVAKFLRLWGGTNVKVTLVDMNASYNSNIMSNLVLNGSTTMSSLTYNYNNLKTLYGINFVQGKVDSIEPPVGSGMGSVRLADGRVLTGNKIILAPGIEFDDVPGLTPELSKRSIISRLVV